MSCQKHDYRVAKTRLPRIGYDVTAYRLQCYHTAVTPVCVNIYVWHKRKKSIYGLKNRKPYMLFCMNETCAYCAPATVAPS